MCEGDVWLKKVFEKAGTLKIKDVDTGEEFIMYKFEVSVFLIVYYLLCKIVKDVVIGMLLMVNEFGLCVGLLD